MYTTLKNIAKGFIATHDLRKSEYAFAKKYIPPDAKVLDAGCGTGTFIEYIGNTDSTGLDINPENVDYCRKKGISAQVGSILEMPYEDHSFDVVNCSHVMQVFTNDQAAAMVKELVRVAKPGGSIIISTLNWFPRFFRHPENTRAYPPDVFWRYFGTQDGVSSPMYPGIPRCSRTKIWLRRPPLFEFDFSVSKDLAGMGTVLNTIQYKLKLLKFWRYQAYVIVLKKL